MIGVTQSKMYYVYVDRTDDGRPYYVGKGDSFRVKNEIRNSLHGRIKRKHGFKRSIEFTSINEASCLSEEERLVAHYKTYAHGGLGWWGANLTRGGESNPMHDPHIKAKVAAIIARPDVKRKMCEASARRRHTEETRAKMRSSQQKRQPASVESRERMRQAALDRNVQGFTGKKHSPETRAILAEKQRIARARRKLVQPVNASVEVAETSSTSEVKR
jgi:hypothetical protein